MEITLGLLDIEPEYLAACVLNALGERSNTESPRMVRSDPLRGIEHGRYIEIRVVSS